MGLNNSGPIVLSWGGVLSLMLCRGDVRMGGRGAFLEVKAFCAPFLAPVGEILESLDSGMIGAYFTRLVSSLLTRSLYSAL